MRLAFALFLFAPVACGGAAPVAAPNTTSGAGDARAEDASASVAWKPPQTVDGDTLRRECTGFVDALKAALPSGDHRDAAIRSAAQGLADHPPAGMAREQVLWCTDKIVEGMKAYIEKSINAEATATLQAIGRDMATGFEKENLGPRGAVTTHALCPSARAVPDALDKLAPRYTSSAADWNGDPGWSCLKFEMDAPQRFQYEVRVDDKTKSFVATARRRGDSQLIEFTLGGQVNGDQLELWQEPKEKRTPLP